ncbi:MAG: phosphosulfolactate synthase, partial [Candidatus Hodarchaeales archaeon]
NFFSDVIESHNEIIDIIKFGWGTSVVTKDLEKKVTLAHSNDIEVFFGGTFFEKALIQDKIDDYRSFCKEIKCDYVEISNGTIPLSNADKSEYISEFSNHFKVLSEVGYKDTQKSLELNPAKWVEFIKQDLDGGAIKVILEARESGKSGICRGNGELRYGLIEEILSIITDTDKLIFETPNKPLQVYFIKKIGPNVNLSNIAFSDTVALETLRLGLRGDTLMFYEKD